MIIPCNYYLTWIERDGQNRHKRGMWCSQRQQSSYTIGSYRDRFMAHPDNQTKLWISLNSITEKLWYNDDINQTMRFFNFVSNDKYYNKSIFWKFGIIV